MKRKVIKQGNNTLTITLPRGWCEQFNVKSGEEIDVEERGSAILINTQKEKNLEKVEINLAGLDRSSILYYIRALYRRGFDEIVVRFEDPLTKHYRIGKETKVMSVIHTEVNRLVGVEIIEQKNNMCIIKDVSGDSFKDFEVILRKVFLVIGDALKDLTTGVKDSNMTLLEEIEEKHDTTTKFISYCLRLLNKKGYPDHHKTMSLYMIIETLDIIVDIIKYAARDFGAYLNQHKKPKKETIEVVETIKDDFEQFYHLFYTFDLKRFSLLNEIRDKAIKQIETIAPKIPQKELIMITDLKHILENVREVSATRMGMEY